MNKKVKILVFLAVAVFIVWNLITLLIGKTTAEMVQYGALEDTFSAHLYLFKDEVVIDSAQGGVLRPTVGDGERVHKGARVGAVLSANTDESALHEYLRIQDRIERLETQDEDTEYAETIRTDEEITALSLQITAAAGRGDIQRVAALKDELLIAKDEKSAFGGQKEALIGLLEGRQDVLEAKIGNSVKEIFSPRAGILLLQTDGLEKDMTLEAAEGLTPDALEAFANRISGVSGGCKILYDNEWRGACIVDAEEAGRMKLGQTVSLLFHECGGATGTVQIVDISPEENGKCVVVFSADRAPEGLMQCRKVTVDVILSRHEGLQVPKKALVDEGGKTGVYVQTITEQVFKEVEVSHVGEEYAIIKEGKKTALKLYDTVVY